MFGFPFFTSLIATIVLVVAISFVINKGIAKKKTQQESKIVNVGSEKTDPNCHA